MLFVIIIISLLAGAAIVFAIMLGRVNASEKKNESKFNDSDRQCGILNDRLSQTLDQLKSVEGLLSEERKLVLSLNSSVSEQKTISANLKDKLESQKGELELIQQRFTTEFENLSSKILEEKSQKFTDQNRTNLDIILTPLREKILEFEKKIDESYKLDAAERNSLKGEIKNLVELNKQISDEANNLARALKGDTKKQGNWGEVILERVLERSGLTKGSEYDLQFSTSNEEGKRIQPDVVIYLPDNKQIIIDAKVSLIAYENAVNAVTEEERERSLKDHITSVRNHIRLLGEKNYFSSHHLTTPDFVLIFMPIESSFGLAVQADTELFNYAWDRKIVLVSPSTLLATLKTISAIWKQEKQTRNALEIARVGGALYDKFCNFLKDMNNIGDKILAAKQSHDEAMNKLQSGPGNIIKKVDELRKLGAKTTKEISPNILERAEENDSSGNF